MSDAKDQTLSLNVRLNPVSPLRTRARRTIGTSAWPRGSPMWILNSFAINVANLQPIGGGVCRQRQRRRR
jgi:hypothetical protein